MMASPLRPLPIARHALPHPSGRDKADPLTSPTTARLVAGQAGGPVQRLIRLVPGKSMAPHSDPLGHLPHPHAMGD